jgi:pimeloyl-ACP methyl ester carboxylesterase
MEEIFYDPTVVTTPWVEAVRTRLLNRDVALRVVRFARATRSETLEQCLDQIRVPTLILWGRDDRITPMHVARRFHSGIRGSRLVVLDRCGHAPMIERPAEFSSILSTWLNRTRKEQPCAAYA